MAMAARDPDHSTKVIEEGLTCCICYNFLREPKELDCPHVYCLQCLQEWAKRKPTIKCPECRHITVVPKGGLVNLKTNLRLRSMVEDYVKFWDKRKGVPMCPNHNGERQHFFCVTCGITVCHNCLVLEHPRPQHDIKELKVIAQTQKTEMKTKVDHVQETIKRVYKQKQELNEKEGKLKARREKARGEIKKRVQEIVAKVKGKGDQLMSLIERNYQQNLTFLQEEQNLTDNRFSQMQNVHSRAQNVVDATSDHQFLQQQQSLVDQIDRLCLTDQSEMSSLDWGSLQFNPGYVLQDMAWLGHVGAYSKGTCNLPGSGVQEPTLLGHVNACSNGECKLTLVSEFGTFNRAAAVAGSRTGQLVVVDVDRHASIYKKFNDGYKHQYSLGLSSGSSDSEFMMYPTDVAITSDGNILVIDYVVVMVFSPTGRYESSWSTDASADRITTTPDNMVVTGSGVLGVIAVHQSNGELIRTHKVDYKAIVGIASNGKQIAFTKGRIGKVCVIDFVTGRTMWTLDMVRPVGICYEQKSNALLVTKGLRKRGTNLGHYVIEQYCSKTGRLISRLASGLHDPWTMTVTHDSKLAVADKKTVKVYQIDYD